MTARDLALLDLLSRGFLPPPSSHPKYEEPMAEWISRYRARLHAATRMLEAVDRTAEEVAL